MSQFGIYRLHCHRGGGVFEMKLTQIYTSDNDNELSAKIQVAKAQSFCKIFRANIVKITLREMSEKFSLNSKTLSAWEHGRVNKAEYLFYYYNLTDDLELKKQFLDVIFNSEGKDIIIDTTVSLDTNEKHISIRLEDKNS